MTSLAAAARDLGMQADGHVLYTTRARQARIDAPHVATTPSVDWWLGQRVRRDGVVFLCREFEPGKGLLFEAVRNEAPSFRLSAGEASSMVRRGRLEVL